VSQPLNKRLYDMLVGRFGEVRILNEGMRARYTIVLERKLNGESYLKPSVMDGHNGEQYMVCCPYCGDTRFRLCVSYLCGTVVHEAGQEIPFGWYLVNCFNEQCDTRRFSEELKPYVVRSLNRIVIDDSRGKEVEQNKPQELPAGCVSLSAAPDFVLDYVRNDRRFDPQYLSDTWGIRYAPESSHPMIRNRLVIPIYFRYVLVGFQTRQVGKPVGDFPKYWTSQGMKKSIIIYNWDRAKTLPALVITEGVTDAWRCGPMGTAIFGKKLSVLQARLVCSEFQDKTVFICLDGSEESDMNKTHERLRSEGYRGNIVPVRLHPDYDPADYTTEELHRIIGASCEKF